MLGLRLLYSNAGYFMKRDHLKTLWDLGATVVTTHESSYARDDMIINIKSEKNINEIIQFVKENITPAMVVNIDEGILDARFYM